MMKEKMMIQKINYKHKCKMKKKIVQLTHKIKKKLTHTHTERDTQKQTLTHYTNINTKLL